MALSENILKWLVVRRTLNVYVSDREYHIASWERDACYSLTFIRNFACSFVSLRD